MTCPPFSSNWSYCLRPVNFGRENYLFAGSDKDGERAAAICTLIQTARPNIVDPEA